MSIFNPNIESKNYKEAKRALDKVLEESVLLNIIRNVNVVNEIQVEAIKKITSESILKKVFDYRHIVDSEIRKIAITKLTDEGFLFEIMGGHTDSMNGVNHFGFAAFNRLKELGVKQEVKIANAMFQMISRMHGEKYRRELYSKYMPSLISLEFVIENINSCYFNDILHLVSKQMILKACAEYDEDRKYYYYKKYGVVDGKIIKSSCEVYKHDLKLDRTYWTEHDQTADSIAGSRPRKVEVYKCIKCGIEIEEMTGEIG